MATEAGDPRGRASPCIPLSLGFLGGRLASLPLGFLGGGLAIVVLGKVVGDHAARAARKITVFARVWFATHHFSLHRLLRRHMGQVLSPGWIFLFSLGPQIKGEVAQQYEYQIKGN